MDVSDYYMKPPNKEFLPGPRYSLTNHFFAMELYGRSYSARTVKDKVVTYYYMDRPSRRYKLAVLKGRR